jgi:hypothetical protein
MRVVALHQHLDILARAQDRQQGVLRRQQRVPHNVSAVWTLSSSNGVGTHQTAQHANLRREALGLP